MTHAIARRLGAAVAVFALTGAIAACSSTKSGNGTAQGSVPPSSTSALPSDTGIPTESATVTDTATPSATPTTSAATSTAATSSAPTVKPTPACAASALAVRVIRGGAALGQEIALITFTNSSSAACTLTGFPSVRLLRGGQLIGSPSKAATVAPKLLTLAPGAQAESQVTDYSSCQAPVSDTMRITAPGASASVDKPYEMRACTVVVAPVSLSS